MIIILVSPEVIRSASLEEPMPFAMFIAILTDIAGIENTIDIADINNTNNKK
jgi:hypothetical protein